MKTAYLNTHIFNHYDANAFLVEDDRIAAIGNSEQIADMADEVIDLHGLHTYPGFHDSHMHLIMTGQALTCASLGDAKNIADIQQRLKAELTDSSVVHGMGWNQETLEEKRMPVRADLDEVSADVPIVIERACTHILTANSAAMKHVGVWHEDGIFAEDDCIPFMKLLEENEESQIVKAVDHCLERGLTCVQPADLKSGIWKRRLPLYKEQSNRIRIHHQINTTDPEEMKEFLEAFKDYETPTHTIGAFKGFADGALGGRTAWMQEDYHDDPGNRGQCTMDAKAMDEFVRTCKELGRPCIFHAIGDQAIKQIMDTYDKYMDEGNPLRWGIIHVQITDQKLLDRMIAKKVLIYAQPVFWKADGPVVASRVGKEKAATSYAFGTLYRGTHLSMGTDCPIEDCNVFENGMWALRLPDAMRFDEVIDACTMQGAYSEGKEEELGKIAEGFLADLTFLDEMWMPSGFPKVVNTMVAGKLTHPFDVPTAE